jgi:hypothetical protein
VIRALCLGALLCLAACGKDGATGAGSAKPSGAKVASAAPSGSAKGPTATAADDPTDKENIPVAEDFEDEAEKAINDETLDDEIGKLKKEIEEDKE